MPDARAEGHGADVRGAMPGPAFSVIVPLYNKCEYVRQTILRILDQHYPHFELLVVDDGSTDGSVDRIADLADGRLRILRQPNGGPGAARNMGIAHARHEWIAFVDADDAWYPDHLSELARAIVAHPSAGIASTAYVKRANGPELPPRPESSGRPHLTNYFDACRRRNVVCASTVAVRRDVFDRVGMFRAAFPGEDTDMWVRAGLHVPLAISPRVTAIYAMDTGGVSDTARREKSAGGGAAASRETPVAVLHDALADPALQPLHGAIRTYVDARALSAAKNAIFDGDRMRARQALGRVFHRSGRRFIFYGALARSPQIVFAAFHAAWRLGRSFRRRMPARIEGRIVAVDAPEI